MPVNVLGALDFTPRCSDGGGSGCTNESKLSCMDQSKTSYSNKVKPVVWMKVKPVIWIGVKLFVQMELDIVVFFSGSFENISFMWKNFSCFYVNF